MTTITKKETDFEVSDDTLLKKIFHTKQGTPLQIVGGDVKNGTVWVIVRPGANNSFTVSIGIGGIMEPVSEIQECLDILKKQNSA